MNIYFSGSIRGGRQDAALYHRLIVELKRRDTVLTEHIGALTGPTEPAGAAGDGEIYAQDTAWLRESDVVIAECSTPSLGVGYELAYAEARGIPCFVFCRRGVALSAMIAGDPYFSVSFYEGEEQLLVLAREAVERVRSKS